jgi:hypothetical protein
LERANLGSQLRDFRDFGDTGGGGLGATLRVSSHRRGFLLAHRDKKDTEEEKERTGNAEQTSHAELLTLHA